MNTEKREIQEGIRINKYLSEAGVCSRRAADREIEKGNVLLDGRKAVTGDRVLPGMRVTFCGKEVCPETEEIMIAFHKPVGIVCTAEKREKNNIIDFINYPKRIYPVGRLDKDSEGLILLTNQGDLVNKMMRAGNYHEKEYVVTVNEKITPEFLEQMRGGLYLEELGVHTRPCKVTQVNDRTFRIILTQGYNRQIRRMCETCGYRVKRLVRTRVMNILLSDLAPGTYRELTAEEMATLNKLTAKSYSSPKGKNPGKRS
ncbi:pseudouridine synthase [uncultured Eubacterium sp.]|uniref:pseudouridine synthase n=1 Tax=uncultured Eubacterium sp. TaxID=165185 RepID=UPI0025FADD43|nr:pseudouridine synthase [uncultured Eubacterium sp.]